MTCFFILFFESYAEEISGGVIWVSSVNSISFRSPFAVATHMLRSVTQALPMSGQSVVRSCRPLIGLRSFRAFRLPDDPLPFRDDHHYTRIVPEPTH